MLLFTQIFSLGLARDFCAPGEACWPTKTEIEELADELGPAMKRSLYWEDKTEPLEAPPPVYSTDAQPLYGLGTPVSPLGSKESLKPVYELEGSDSDLLGSDGFQPECFPGVKQLINGKPAEDIKKWETREVCLASTRNNPRPGTQPAFVVFALNSDHVVTAVNFAVKHNLCMAVAGTGHDFLNRHSCKNGMMIRTTLIKGIRFEDDPSRPGEENVVVGSGSVWGELQKAASERGKAVATGWVRTVGVAGWSMGGGHGPMANYAGLGVDNIVAAKVVTADGLHRTVDKNNHPDLLYAIKGGGGSTFGIVTEFTIRTHTLPKGGVTTVGMTVTGDFCRFKWWKNGGRFRDELLERYVRWTTQLDKRWSGLGFVYSTKGDWHECGADWTFFMNYFYYGSKEDAMPMTKKIQQSLKFLKGAKWEINEYPNMYEPTKGSIADFAVPNPSVNIIPLLWSPNGVPSNLVSREKVESGAFTKKLIEALEFGKDKRDPINMFQIYHDITGARDSPQATGVAISPAFRDAMYHFVFDDFEDKDFMNTFYEELGENVYQNEAAYDLHDWREQIWTQPVYNFLLSVKKHYDPDSRFWCRHCVGDRSDLQDE